MEHMSSSERLAEALLRAERHWQTRSQAEAAVNVSVKPAPAAFTVAISREAGANGAVIAGRLGDRLGWPVYDRALLEWIAGEMGLRTSLLESVDEKRVSWLRECVEAFTSAPGVTGG